MKRLFFFIFLHLIVFLILITSYVYAEDKVFVCKPTIAGLQLDSGKYYFENEHDDDRTPFIDKLTTTQFILNKENIFYKNNKNRSFEQLIPYKSFLSIDLPSHDLNLISKAIKIFQKWDKILDLPALTKDFETYIYLYSFNQEDDNLNHSIKRISIDIKNLMTSEITVPITSKTPAYFVARLCKNSNLKELN